MDAALAMAAAVRSHQAAAELLRDGQAEQSFWWDDADTGLRCKCRPDWLNGATVIDLKTTTDASPAGFAKSCATFRYHVQASHYLAGLPAERFIFIAVEKVYPYAVGVYQLAGIFMFITLMLSHFVISLLKHRPYSWSPQQHIRQKLNLRLLLNCPKTKYGLYG